MALNTMLFLAAGAASALGFQDPGFDHQFAIPTQDETSFANFQGTAVESHPSPTQGVEVRTVPAQSSLMEVQSPQIELGPKVSAKFRNAKVNDVLDWLEHQGISFVMGENMVRPDQTVTLNIVDQPAGDVADAIAAALGGHWDRRGNIRVFQPGSMTFGSGSFAGGNFSSFPAVAGSGSNKEIFMPAQGFSTTNPITAEGFMAPQIATGTMEGFAPAMAEGFAMPGQQIEVRVVKDGKTIKKVVDVSQGSIVVKIEGGKITINGADGSRSVVLPKEVELEIAKAMKSAENAQMQAQINLEIAKAMQGKELAKDAVSRRLNEKEVQIAIADGGKRAAEVMNSRKVQEALRQAREVEVKVVRSKEVQEALARAHASGDAQIKIERRIRHDGQGSSVSGSIDAKRLLESLTPNQQDTLRKRGYVLYMDLTPDQKKMLGEVPKGRFSIKLKIDGQQMEIRGS
jgi:hypothetical protein